jgi:hypothetical protein
MDTTKHEEPEVSDGAPLAVCVNDCQLDYGQARSELVRICFQVGCAFAEMRWGSSAAAAFGSLTPRLDEKQ